MHSAGHTARKRRTTDVDRLIHIVNGAAMSRALCVAAELGIPDLLAGGPKSASELAETAACDPQSLRRLMRALAALDVCRENRNGSFSLTSMGELLRKESEQSLRDWTLWGVRHLWPLWETLHHSVKTGQSARTFLSGTEGFEHLEHDELAATTFHRAMAEVTRRVAARLAHSYDCSSTRRVVDVGGGYGELLAALLRANPEMRGVLFDRPHAVAGARRYLEAAGVIAHCDIVVGDFFVSIPAGADRYFLKSVIHDWDDERCRTLLRHCRSAMPNDGKLVMIEQIMPERMKASAFHQDAARKDLSMLVGPGGRERTASEFKELLESAGLALQRVVPTVLGFSVLEAVGS